MTTPDRLFAGTVIKFCCVGLSQGSRWASSAIDSLSCHNVHLRVWRDGNESFRSTLRWISSPFTDSSSHLSLSSFLSISLFKLLNPISRSPITIMMYADLASVSCQPAMMSLRPHHDPYRSLPCTPLGIDPRSLAAVDLAPMLNHARMSLGMEAQDYFSSSRYGGSARASSPYSHAADVESVYEADVPGLVCRCVALPF